MSTHVAAASPAPTERPRTLTLDDLAAMSVDELTALYQSGRVPDDLHALDGDPTCRMLTVVGPVGRGAVAGAVRGFARSRAFPWAGKRFAADAADRGHGINRLRLAGERPAFPFDTSIQPSAIDGEPCIVLDYDKPENPWFIRQVHDELREVDPGLFLGPAMWKTKADPALVLYFACDRGEG